MPNMPPSRLAQVLADVLKEAILSASDRWVRAEIPVDWPVVAAVREIARSELGLRLGVLRPFVGSHFTQLEPLVSSNASEITGWRNEPIDVRRSKPTVVLGDARGSEEAGLRVVPRIVTAKDVLERWHRDIIAWLAQNIEADPPAAMFDNLFRLAEIGIIDADRLDDYANSTLRQPDPIQSLRSNLWRINLIPDDHILDTGAARQRLDLNIETRQLLLAASDAQVDLARIERLRQKASEGNKLAQRMLQYREQQDNQLLKGAKLDELLAMVAAKPGPRPSPPPQLPITQHRRVDLFELLDNAAEVNIDQIERALSALAKGWNLASQDPIELTAMCSTVRGYTLDVQVEVSPTPPETVPWTGDGSPETQMVAFVAVVDGQRDWSPSLPTGTPVPGDQLLRLAQNQDGLLDQPVFKDLVAQYLTARAELVRYEKWLRKSGLELLLLQPAAREAVEDYLAAWQLLLTTAGQAQYADVAAIRNALIQLEAMWGNSEAGDSDEWCVLGSLHPYVLHPILRLAKYTLSNLGTEHLGTKLGWALDRSIPAYELIWSPRNALALKTDANPYVFQGSLANYHTSANEGNGLYQVAKAFLGFHPYARQALVVTLIDPPKGAAIGKNLRRLQQDVEELRVYLVSTRGDAARLDEAGEAVRDLGRFSSIDGWLKNAPMRSHIVFYFAEHSAARPGPARGSWGPAAGAYVALQIRLDSPSPLEHPDMLIPFVTFEPNRNNDPVVAIQKLAALSFGAPRLFQVQPMVSDDMGARFAQIVDVADWAVFGAPAPLGLVAPRQLGHDLTYIGRESLGTYGLFVYATSLFSVRKAVTQRLRSTAVLPVPEQVEARLTDLAVQSANGVLRIGQVGEGVMWEQVGVIISSAVSRGLDA